MPINLHSKSLRNGTSALLLFPMLGLADHDAAPQGPLLQVELANDILFRSDNQFTNGIGFNLHSASSDSLEHTGGTPAFGRALAAPLLPDNGALLYRETWALGHSIQTPDNIETRELIRNDVPYVAALTWSNSYYGFNNQEFHGVQWMFGWVGPDAGGDSAQRAVHTLTGSDNPRGWDNQLGSEPLLNLQYSTRRKLYSNSWFDASVSGDLALGNWTTFAEAGLELRLGDKPPGFAYVPDRPGRGVKSNATNPSEGASYLYGTIIFRGTGTAYNMLYDGNLIADDDPWTKRNTIAPETWTANVIFGLHYTTPNWGAHLTLWLSTDTVDPDGLASGEDPQNNYGLLMLDYQF